MSSIHNRVTSTFTASGGQAIAVMGEIGGAAMSMGRQMGQIGQQTGQVERGFRALGTTIRYALAGTAVFAIPNMVRQLADVQQQLGLMTAIGTQPGGMPVIGQQLRQLGQDAQVGALNAITPINEFNDAVINFLSTVQNVPSSQVPDLVTEIARAAKLSQTPVEDATKAFTTMSVAFGRPLNAQNARSEVRKTAQEFFILTKQAPGGIQAGPQIIQQLGQLAQVTRVAGGTRPQLLGLLLSTLRSGIPPAQSGRGLQFLLQTIGLPGQGSKESEQALASVGIRPGNREPLLPKLGRIFQHARQLSFQGNLGRVSRLDDETLAGFDEQGAGGSAALLKGLGITGPGAVFLGQVFHRVHALRTAIALLGQFDTGQYQKDIKVMADAEQGHVKDVNDLSKQWVAFRKQAKLKEAATALSVLQLQIAQTFEPILNPIAGGITATTRAAQHHRDATRIIAGTGAGLLSAGLLARLFGARVPGLGIASRLGRGAPAAMAVENALSGQIPKGTATDPLFVIPVTDIFGRGRGTLQYPTPIGPARGPTAGGGRFGWARSLGGLKYLPLAGMGAIADQVDSNWSGGSAQKFLRQNYPSLYAAGLRNIHVGAGGKQMGVAPKGAPGWLQEVLQSHTLGVANRIVRDRMTRVYTNMGGSANATATQIAMAVLKGSAELDITYNQPDGKKATKKVHVRTDSPQFRGQPKSPRR